jgi:serine/threonine protein kinase
MPSRTDLWTEVTTSQHDHERAALHFIRQRFPDREPFRAWTNFMFIADDGTRNEVDLLAVTPTGVYLVEIKSFPGRIDGDAGTWKWTAPDGYQKTFDNPLLLAERKAKKLKSLLVRQQAFRTPKMRGESFYLKSIVFLSNPDLTVGLDEPGRTDVYGPDADDESSSGENDLPGLIRLFARINPKYGREVDRPLSRAIADAVDQAGIRESTTHRKIGQYELGELLDEGEGWQDFAAQHPEVESTHRRIRLYLAGRAYTEEERAALTRAAEREFKFLQGIDHPGLDRPLELLRNPRGPALIFEREPDAERLDHWLADHGEELELYDRIQLVRDLAEIVRHAHRQGLFHRALAPQHVTVVSSDNRRELKIRDWQTAARKLSSTSSGASGTRHIPEHVSQPAQVYLAPETLRLAEPEPLRADIWSLGAVAFLILSGEPPAKDLDSLHELLREQGHLTLATAMDAPPRELDRIIRHATEAEATSRFVSVDEFLEFLDFAVDELTKPEEKDPIDAARGDTVGERWTVQRRLGTGSTSVVLLVETPEREEVLKVARDEEHGERIEAEYEVLSGLRDRTIIEPYGLERIAGRTVLRLEKALGTLTEELRERGSLTLDRLERFGTDLLDAVVFIDDEGVAHRDIKPENLGIAERGKDQERHLVLFDFSLSRSSPEDLHVGTVGYLDPFLEERDRPSPRWDQQAERYAAAVTLYEMATGTRPKWGDGSTDPALTDLELPNIDNKLFDSSVRGQLTSFFERALRRDPNQRFATADQMRRAWKEVFAQAERVQRERDEPQSVEDIDLEGVIRDTPLAELPLAPKVRNAIERLDVVTLGELADFPPPELVRLGGIGAATRREINRLAQRLREHFESASLETGPGIPSVDRLADQLVPKPPADNEQRTVVAAFLALEGEGAPKWPTHRDTSARSGLEREVVADALTTARSRWSRRPDITEVRGNLVGRLAQRGGVAGGDELASILLTERGSLAQDPLRSARARAVVRAAVEVEAGLQHPRFLARRIGEAYLVALEGEVEVEDSRGSWDADRLFDAAALLGEAAEEIVAGGAVLPFETVVAELRSFELPSGVGPFADTRLVKLAAAASPKVSISTRLELYPSGMDPDRTVEEARPVLLDRRGLSVDEVRHRIRARFPKAAPLPDRPELDRLLESIDLQWDREDGRYVLPHRSGVLSTFGSSGRSTTSFETNDERDAAVRRFEERLDEFREAGGFLALTVDRRRLDPAIECVASYTGAEHLRFERMFIDEMRSIVEGTKGARWDRILEADNEKGERGWSVLQQLVDRAVPEVVSILKETEGLILLTGFGLLARYDRFGILEDFRDLLTRKRGAQPLSGMILIVPGDDPSARPVVDGRPLPVITANQWAHLPSAWLQSRLEGQAA